MSDESKQKFWQMWDQVLAEHDFRLLHPAGAPHNSKDPATFDADCGVLEGTVSTDDQGLVVWKGQGAQIINGLLMMINERGHSEAIVLVGCLHSDVEQIVAHYQQQGLSALLIQRWK